MKHQPPCDCYHGGKCTRSTLCAVQAVEAEKEEITDALSDFMVHMRTVDDVAEIREYAQELFGQYDTYDPTPYCTVHGPKSACTCGPIAHNE